MRAPYKEGLIEELRRLDHRDKLPKFLKKYGLNKRICELGVLRGENFRHLLECEPELAVGVDRWVGVRRGKYLTTLKTEFAGDRGVRFLKTTTAHGSTKFRDGFFDFVYIDAGHSYGSVAEDIALWWPKVRVGGIMAGHDYCDHNNPESPSRVKKGVKLAVQEFIIRNNIQVCVITKEEYASWVILRQI